MPYYPFFVHVDFFGFQDEATPFTTVEKVQLGFIGSNDLEISEFPSAPTVSWKSVGEWLRGFKKFGNVVPVGYNLRNLVWPAIMANMARDGESVPGLYMQMEKKWNSLDMVDLQGLVLQGGYSDYKPSLQDACRFFGIELSNEKPTLYSIYELYKAYQRVS